VLLMYLLSARFVVNTTSSYYVGSEALATVLMTVAISWDIAPCSSYIINQRFGETYRLHLHGRKSAGHNPITLTL
jgi:hypothetical protein